MDVPHEVSGPADAGRVCSSATLLAWAAVVGGVGGLLALGYYLAMRAMLHLAWGVAGRVDVDHLGLTPAFRPGVLVVTTAGGAVVGLVLRLLGKPGEIAAVVDNIHMDRGRIDPRQTPAMVAASLASITAGGSAGPEAPLVQILGSFGSFVGDRLRLRGDLVRTLTFCGMAAALGAFFGAPLGGTLFALEIPHRRGLEYYESLLPALLAAVVAFVTFRAFAGYEGPIYHLAAVGELSVGGVLVGAVAGLGGGAVGAGFIAAFRRTERLFHPLARRTVLLATVGGLAIGLVAQLAPVTLFWGESQIVTLLAGAGDLRRAHGVGVAVAVLLAVSALKAVAVGVTLHSGFRGGFIFPLFFIGAGVGAAAALVISTVYPAVPAPVVVLCVMAATNVAVTKTPVSTAVIVTSVSGTAFLPAVVAACLASFLLTSRTSLISTQRSRAAAIA